MSNYKIETKCIQSGYEPGNGEPRVLPIYQSTTFKYNRIRIFLYKTAESNQ